MNTKDKERNKNKREINQFCKRIVSIVNAMD